MGRPRKPTAIKILTGNPGRRPIIADSIKVESILPPAPDHLLKEAKAEWNRLAPSLYALRMLSVLDLAAFGAYCQAYATWKTASLSLLEMGKQDLLTSGLMMRTSNGNAIQNPVVGIMNKAALDMVRYASEFGMTPSARARINTGGDNPTLHDPAEKYFS